MFVQYIYSPSDKYITVNVLLVKTFFKMKNPKTAVKFASSPNMMLLFPPIESNEFWCALSIYEYNNKVYKFVYKLRRRLTVCK